MYHSCYICTILFFLYVFQLSACRFGAAIGQERGSGGNAKDFLPLGGRRTRGIVFIDCPLRMKKYCSYTGEVGKTAPNLLNRVFCEDKPNQK